MIASDARRRTRLADEAFDGAGLLDRVRVHDFDGDAVAELEVKCVVYDPGAAAADFPIDPILVCEDPAELG
jgi:hypothetical protein